MILGGYAPDQWSFDVSSLIVLVGESEEENYRLSQRNLPQALAAVPVVGLQNYIRSYDLLLEPGSLTYYSPYGNKTAPLRNLRLENAIKLNGLLKDKTYNVFSIPPKDPSLTYPRLLWVWMAFTWVYFGGLLVFLVLVPTTTWVGMSNCVALTAWSIILRVVEWNRVQPAGVEAKQVTDEDDHDAVFIMGRDSSAFVLEGDRIHIKNWTSRGLVYLGRGWAKMALQAFTRAGSFLMLLFIFSTVPNGTTMDQLAFILLNAMAQVHILLGQWLNSRCCLAQLDHITPSGDPPLSRTAVYGNLVRHFSKDGRRTRNWVAAGLLPDTPEWNAWQDRVVATKGDAKDLYTAIAHEIKPHKATGVMSLE